MSRRNQGAAESAAAAASEAARVLQSRQQESRQESQPEPQERTEPADPKEDRTPPRPAKDDEPVEKQTVAIKRGNPNRDAILADIRKNRGENEPEETQPATPAAAAPTTAPAQPIPATPSTDTEPPAEPPPAAQPDEVPPIPAVEVVKVKIDGEEFDVPKAEVEEAGGIGPFRILKAAENRLRKANETLAESRRIAAHISQQQPQQPTAPRPSDKDIMANLAAARFGTDEEYTAALDAAFSRGRVDPNGIVREAVAEMQKTQAMAEFQRDYPDVIASPMAMRLAVSLENEVVEQVKQAQQQGLIRGPLDWQKIYRTIGTQVRNAFGGPARQSQPAAPNAAAATTAANQPSNPSPVSDKEARKASIVTLPTAAARAVTPEEPKPETREESLNRMRARRGLPTV